MSEILDGSNNIQRCNRNRQRLQRHKFDVDCLASSRATSSPVTKRLCLTHACGQRHETEHGDDLHR